MPGELHVLPQSAYAIASAFSEIASDLLPDLQLTLTVKSAIDPIFFTTQSAGRAMKDNAQKKEFVERLSERQYVPCASAGLYEQQNQSRFHLQYKGSGTESHFTLTVNDPKLALDVVDALHSRFTLMTRSEVLGQSLAPEVREMIQFRANSVASLEAAVEQLGVVLGNIAEKTAEATLGLTTRLESSYQDKLREADESFRKKQDSLDREREAFKKDKAAFDDRQSKHARRELLTKIQQSIEMQHKAALVTAPARRGRLLIHGATITILLLFATGAGIAGNELFRVADVTPFDWRLVPTFTLPALVFIGVLIFYLRWMSSWADRLAHHDMSVAQYASDILRANWIAELLFEYKDEEERELPQEILSSFTEGLFRREELQRAKYHPADDALSAIGKVRSLTAGPGGVELKTRK